MSIFGTPVANRMQLFHYDNGDREFIRRRILGQAATEFDNSGDPKRSWVDYYQTLYRFNGIPGISADAVQLAYERHFHLELHDILPDGLRPPHDDSMCSPYIAAIANARVIEITKSAKPRTIYQTLTYILGAALFVELIIWGLAIYVSRG